MGQQGGYIKRFWQQAQAALQAGQIADREVEDVASRRFLRLEAHPIAQVNMPGAQSAFAVIVIRDITMQKQYEQGLAQQNQVLQTLNQLSREISSTLDLDAILNTAVHSAVECLQVTSGYISDWDEENSTFTHIASYYHPQAPISVSLSDVVAIHWNGGELGELAHWLKNAHTVAVTQLDERSDRWRNLQKFKVKTVLRIPLQAKGKKIGILELWESRYQRQFTSTEIDLALAIAQQIALAIDNARLYEQALVANRLKSALLANVSHELRTPLGVILIHAEMLQEGVYGSVSERQQAILDETITNTQWLNRLVNDLIDRAQLEAGQLKLRLREFRLSALLTAVQTPMSILAQPKGVTLICDLDPELPQTIVGDSERIQQILLNLVSNAIKFTDKGQVTVTVFREDNDFWGVRVADTGVGIPQKAQSYIFEPFRQVDNTSTRMHGGSGLGLSIAKQLTELMGGQLSVESVVGVGSTFTILLPFLA